MDGVLFHERLQQTDYRSCSRQAELKRVHMMPATAIALIAAVVVDDTQLSLLLPPVKAQAKWLQIPQTATGKMPNEILKLAAIIFPIGRLVVLHSK